MHPVHLSAIVLYQRKCRLQICSEAGDNTAMVAKEAHSKMNCSSAACNTARNQGMGLLDTVPCCVICPMNAEERQILLFGCQFLLCRYQVFKDYVTTG